MLKYNLLFLRFKLRITGLVFFGSQITLKVVFDNLSRRQHTIYISHFHRTNSQWDIYKAQKHNTIDFLLNPPEFGNYKNFCKVQKTQSITVVGK
jgi:hypothetical protein